jgi:hypothetical protein
VVAVAIHLLALIVVAVALFPHVVSVVVVVFARHSDSSAFFV